MRGAFRSEPKFLAIFTSLNARRISARSKVPGDIYQVECEAFFGHARNSSRYLPIWTRVFFQSEPKFLAIFTNSNARRVSVRTKIPGDFPQFKCGAFFGQNRNSWRYVPISIRDVTRWEPKSLAVSTSPNERRFSARTATPGNIYQFECEAFFGQNQNSWRYVPV